MKLKERIKEMIISIKEAVKLFPVTITFTSIITLILTFFIIGVKEPSNVIEDIITVLSFTCFGTWFTEVIFSKKEHFPFKILGTVISVIIGFIFKYYIKMELEASHIIYRVLCEYMMLTILISIYILLKKSKESLEKYFLNLFLNLKKIGILYGIVAIGILILYAIFTFLIFDKLEFYYIGKILTLFAGLYIVPLTLKAFTNHDGEDTKFNRGVFSKVLLPLVCMSIIIVYIYIGKIIFFTEIPKNEIFFICSLIFVTAYPIYIINRNYVKDTNIFKKIVNIVPYSLILLVCLEIYSMGLRISNYGYTTDRYFAIVFIIVQIMYIILTCIKKSKYLGESIVGLCIISFVVFLSPFNFLKIPQKSQLSIVNKYVSKGVEFDSLDIENQRKYAGAFIYLDKDIQDTVQLSIEEKEKLKSFSNYYTRYSIYNEEDNNIDKEITIYLNESFNNIDISRYSNIYTLSNNYNYAYTSYDWESQKNNIDDLNQVYEFSLKDSDYNIITKTNVKKYIDNIIEAYEISEYTADRIFKENRIYSLNDTQDLIFTSLYIDYKINSKEVTRITFEGYVLEK